MVGWKIRCGAAAAGLLTVAAGLGVRAGATGSAAKCAGDALYTVLVYTLVVLVAPRIRPARAAVVAALVSWGVEFFQLTEWPARWSAESGVARLVLGSTFNVPDLLWYAVGAAVCWAVHRGLSEAGGRMRAAREES
ncbi:uncharacterized protein DUF2809 [Streptomyces sp. TLI_235]|nr:DUF2809 domain-containing protein [Streptomyces sp. TLI_235]PBC71432.1 uncharacterized protein DUF2809 [Streptomyces sp. TLI_235]